MASGRVQHMLEEIAGLSPQEQDELVRDLPGVIRTSTTRSGLNLAAVEQAIAARERIRERLRAEHRQPGSILADLDEIRDEVSNDCSTKDLQTQEHQ